MKKYIPILLAILIFLPSCILSPVNSPTPLKNGDQLDIGVLIQKSNISGWYLDDIPPVVPYISYRKKVSENIELYLFGIRLWANLLNNKNIKINIFQSTYLNFIGLGVNTGITFNMENDFGNIYLTLKGDFASFNSGAHLAKTHYFMFFSPIMGFSFKVNNFNLFFQGDMFVKKNITINKIDKGYLLYFGFSF